MTTSERKRIKNEDFRLNQELKLPSGAFYKPILPETNPCNDETDQGDPFVLAVPPGKESKYKYYVYHTDKWFATGHAFNCYATNDFKQFEPIGYTLETDARCFHWAPCVYPVADGYWMIYSRSANETAWSPGQMLRRAFSEKPEGPFKDMGAIELPEHITFSIDPEVYVEDGKRYLAFTHNFVDKLPYGNGIEIVPITEDCQLLAEPELVLRPWSEKHLYEERKEMEWMHFPNKEKNELVDWFVVEGAVGGLISPKGRKTILYSMGNYKNNSYAIGAIQQNEQGEWIDLLREGYQVLTKVEEKGIFSIGHCSLVNEKVIMCHGRFSPDGPRRAFLAPLEWDDQDRPYCPMSE